MMHLQEGVDPGVREGWPLHCPWFLLSEPRLQFSSVQSLSRVRLFATS